MQQLSRWTAHHSQREIRWLSSTHCKRLFGRTLQFTLGTAAGQVTSQSSAPAPGQAPADSVSTFSWGALLCLWHKTKLNIAIKWNDLQACIQSLRYLLGWGGRRGSQCQPWTHPEERMKMSGKQSEHAGVLVRFGSSWSCALCLQCSFSWDALVSYLPFSFLFYSAFSSVLWREMAF